MSSQLQRIIDRYQEKINLGQCYDAHQGIRTVANRYIKSKNYNNAIEILYEGALSLLKNNQQASGSDLMLYLIEIYILNETYVDSISRNRISTLLDFFDVHEPTLIKNSQKVTEWSGKFGPIPSGDSILHHQFGKIFADADEVYEAEKNLLLGTKDSPEVLAKLLFDWSIEHDKINAPIFLSRAVLGYLALENIRDASKSFEVFTQLYLKHYNIINQKAGEMEIFENSLFNFLNLLILVCRSKNPDSYKRLKERYISQLQQWPIFNPAFERIDKVFFGIVPERRPNMLEDLMGSFFN